jgi:hypothetical protein
MGRQKKRRNDGSFEDDGEEEEQSIADVIAILTKQTEKLDKLQVTSDENRSDMQKLHDLFTANQKELAAVKLDTAKLKTDIVTVNADLYELRQELLTNNIVVSGPGVMIDREKSLFENFKRITSLLKFELAVNDVSDVFLVKRRSGPALIVKLVATSTKIQLMDALREQAKLVGQEGIPPELKTIFFSDHLSSYYEHVYYMARMLKKKGKLHRVWTKLGKIYVRETEMGSLIRIRVLETIKDLYLKHGIEI